jgi:DNA-binding PadR family transcriptional regulator
VKAGWTVSETGRKVRLYRITASGRKQLETEMAEYRRTAQAIAAVLETA